LKTIQEALQNAKLGPEYSYLLDPPSLPGRFIKKLFELFCKAVFMSYCPLQVNGRENIPATSFIFCSNHSSHMDSGVLMGASGLPFRQFGLMAAKEYFSFVTGLMFWIGIFFEFPLVIYVLSSMGLVKPAILMQQWRLAIVIIAILAAAITPTIDPVNMGLVMLPMVLLYFVSIGLSYIAYAGRKQKNATGEANADGESAV